MAAAPESTKRSRIKLPCRQDSFYPFCLLAWNYCSEYIAEFAADSPRFTPAYIAAQIAQVNQVKTIPPLDTRKANVTTARINLMAEAQNLKMMAQKLKNYISFAFKNSKLRTAAMKEAGLYQYSRLRTKWVALSGMARSAANYMSKNLGILTANDNMPADFPGSFAQAADKFTAAWDQFKAQESASGNGTGELDNGLEQLLSELMPMLETGRRIFIFHPQVRKKFTVKDLRAEVQGNHPAGLKGTVKQADTGLLLAGVTVSTTVEGKQKSAVTNLKGKFELKLPAGTYDILVTTPGMVQQLFAGRIVKPGVMGRLGVELQPLPSSAEVAVKPIVPVLSTDALLREAMEEVNLAENGTVKST